jgi:acetyl-CoA acetyltransferase
VCRHTHSSFCHVTELLTYEALGLCAEGQGGKLIESGNATYGGKHVTIVNLAIGLGRICSI